MFLRGSISWPDFDDVDRTFVSLIQSAWPYFFFLKVLPSPTLRLDKSSSQITSNDRSRFTRTSSNAVVQDPASEDDLHAIPFDSSKDKDDSNNGQLQKRNLSESLQHSFQHSPSHVSPNVSSLSIKNDISSRAQSDSSKLITRRRKSRNSNLSNHSIVPSNNSESSQQNSSMAKTLLKRDDSTKISSPLRRKKYITLKDAHHDITNHLGQSVTSPKSPVDFSSVTSSSKATFGNGVSSMPQVMGMPSSDSTTSDSFEVVVYPMEPISSNSVSHHSYVPMIQPSLTLTSQSRDDSMILNDDNLDDQKYTSETNNRPDYIPITQPPPLTSRKSLERDIAIVREVRVPGDFASDKPFNSPNVQSPPLNSTTTDNNSISPKDDTLDRKVESRPRPSMISFLLNLVISQVVSTEGIRLPKTQQWRPPLPSLQCICESSDSLPSDGFIPASDDILAQMLSSRTAATPKAEVRPQLQTLQEDNSSTLLRYIKWKQELQTQLDKALIELRDVQAENKRLTGENQSLQIALDETKHEQDNSLVQINNQRDVLAENKRLTSENESLKIALDEAKHERDNSSIQINNQLRVATSSLTILNKEKKGWQNKLDSIQHKLNAAERQVRCLDHLTRHKLELRQETGYGQPKRRGMFASIPASTDVIEAMRALNEEIYQTCVQFVEGLERTGVSSTRYKPQVQKVLGYHLSAMMEDQAKKVTSGYNMLLMQTVLEVFMAHWCSSIIEAFYPQQESFSDLLVQLSAQTRTANTSGK